MNKRNSTSIGNILFIAIFDCKVNSLKGLKGFKDLHNFAILRIDHKQKRQAQINELAFLYF